MEARSVCVTDRRGSPSIILGVMSSTQECGTFDSLRTVEGKWTASGFQSRWESRERQAFYNWFAILIWWTRADAFVMDFSERAANVEETFQILFRAFRCWSTRL